MNTRQLLQRFISERCHRVPGAKTRQADLVDAFLLGYLDDSDRAQTNRREVGDLLDSLGYERGHSNSNAFYLANLAMPSYRYEVRDGKLTRAPL